MVRVLFAILALSISGNSVAWRTGMNQMSAPTFSIPAAPVLLAPAN